MYRKKTPQLHRSYPQESVERSVGHELGDDHDRLRARHDALQVDDVGVVELSHHARLGQEVQTVLLRRPGLQCLDGDRQLRLGLTGQHQTPTTHVAELA